MKKILTIMLVVLCMFAFVGAAGAQTKGNCVVGGVKYTNNAANVKTLGLMGGYGFRVADLGFGGIWSINTVDIGAKQLGSINPDLALVFRVSGDSTKSCLYAGLVAAPNVDFLAAPGSGSYITYLNGAAGGLLLYEFPTHFGFYLAGKYKFALKDEVLFADGFQSAIGLIKHF